MSEERVAHASVDDEQQGGCHLLCVRAHRQSVSQSVSRFRSDPTEERLHTETHPAQRSSLPE